MVERIDRARIPIGRTARSWNLRDRRRQPIAGEQARERGAPEREAGTGEEGAAVDRERVVHG